MPNDPRAPREPVEVAQVLRSELAQILRAYRERSGKSRAEVEEVLDKLLKQQSVPEARAGFELLGRKVSVNTLEAPSPRNVAVTVADLQLLAQVYQMPRLVLDSLLSSRSDGSCHVCPSEGWRRVGSAQSDSPYYGQGTTYTIPRHSLAGTKDVSVVHLVLDRQTEDDPESHSSIHSHIGDELLLVLDGEVEVRLDHNGLSARLGREEFIYFHAEQRHSATYAGPIGGQARVLVIRFNQFKTPSTRAQLLGEAARLRGLILTEKSIAKHFMDYFVRVMTAALDMHFDLGVGTLRAEQVADAAGFARMLKAINSPAFQPQGKTLSLNVLIKESNQRKLGFNRSKLDRILKGLPPIDVDQVKNLAALFQVEPVLFHDYFFPAVRQAVVVRNSDLETVPSDLLAEPGVRYHVPRRHLADSDISVVRLDLDPGARTKATHPGHQLLVPLEGSSEVRIGRATFPVIAGTHRFAHFHCGRDHEVRNTGPSTARFLVVRFYECRSEETDGERTPERRAAASR
jgi:quercetin dioxygenase-like cupin family protein